MVLKMCNKINKICPFMSRPIHTPQCENFSGFIVGATTSLYEVECLGEKCIAWNPLLGCCKLVDK